jgi:hypothetical protein
MLYIYCDNEGRKRFIGMKQFSRRSLIRSCSAVSATVALYPFFPQTSDKAGRRPLVIGSGDHTYECIHDWLAPPDGLVWGDTHGLSQDQAGNIYVAHTVGKSSMRGEAIVVYDENGRFVRAFGEEFRGGAHGLNLRREQGSEVLYHCDINRCKVVKTTVTGEVIWSHG